MYCYLCVNKGTKKCYKKGTVRTRFSKACTHFVFNTSKLPAHIFQTAISLTHLPNTQLIYLMGLLDSEIRLRKQGLHIGAVHVYPMTDPNIVTDTFDTIAYLVSASKRGDDCCAIGIVDKPRKNTIINMRLNKKAFSDSHNKQLKRIWPLITSILLHYKSEKRRRIKLKKIFKKLTKRDIEIMLRENKIKIQVRGRKLIDVINDILIKEM